jgi:hypothetical protein
MKLDNEEDDVLTTDIILVTFQIHLEYNLLIFLKMSIFVACDCM